MQTFILLHFCILTKHSMRTLAIIVFVQTQSWSQTIAVNTQHLFWPSRALVSKLGGWFVVCIWSCISWLLSWSWRRRLSGCGKPGYLVAGFGTLAALLWGFPVPTPGLDHVTSATWLKATQLKHLAVKRVQGQILFSILWEVEKKRWPPFLLSVVLPGWIQAPHHNHNATTSGQCSKNGLEKELIKFVDIIDNLKKNALNRLQINKWSWL